MALKLVAVLMISAFGAISVTSNPVPSDPTVPPGGPKYVPVFVSADSLNHLNEKDGQAQSQLESGQNKPNNDFINKETQNVLYGPPAPVYEHQPDLPAPSYSPPPIQSYQKNQPLIQQQYQNMQTTPVQPTYQQVQQPIQQQQSYPVNQQSFQIQQPNQFQQYQISQPQTQPLYPINQQPQQIQPIVVAQQTGQPIYGNQQQMLQQGFNQQPLLNQQQPINTYQQPNLLIGQPNQQTTLTQSTQPILISQQTPIPNQQIILQQPNQNGQIQAQIPNQQSIILQQPNQNSLITSNPVFQPSPVNPGYIQDQNQNLYAVVPVSGQHLGSNQNVGSNTYLVPVQPLPNQVLAVNSG